MKVYMLPTPEQAAQDDSNAINQIVLKLAKHLPTYGWEVTAHKDEADLIAGHAGQTDGSPVDVAHVHGLMPTAAFPNSPVDYAINAHVLNNVRDAREVTVPSEWVGDIFRRDMHINPHVIGWAIDHEDWKPGINAGYVLWNKTRPGGVCDPTPINELARRLPTQKFITTFGDDLPNLNVIGRQTYPAMKTVIQSAGVYLATTRETFGIGTVEAMACGIPILGYNWGGTRDIVEHGITGFLAEPGDIDGLVSGLAYCQEHREQLGINARARASLYSWQLTAAQFAQVYNKALVRPQYKLTVVVPLYNYAAYIETALRSILAQVVNFDYEIIVVDDGSTDDGVAIARRTLDGAASLYRIVTQGNTGPAGARNTGIALANSEYILCLDADDILMPDTPMLQTLADALDHNRRLGIAYTGLTVIEGEKSAASPWPGRFNFEEQIARRNQVPTCCMFRKEAWARAGGYRKAYEPAEDAELWTRITSLGYQAEQVTSEHWFVYRMHENSFSRTRREPDWVAPFPWIKTGDRPMAAPPPTYATNPTNAVRDYDRPLFSVVIPCGKGHEDYVRAALDSVEYQTDWRWEAIVVFDHAYVPEPGKWDAYSWARLFWTNSPPRGPGHARNYGAARAVGKFLIFLDADDYLHPEFIELTYRKFKETGRYVYTDWVSIGKDGGYEVHQCPEYDLQTLFRRQSLHAVTILLPKTDFDAIGGFEEGMGAWEDVEIYLHLATAGFCGVRLAKPLFTYRYQTGKLREHGETIKGGLKAILYDRYKDYAEGVKMCDCEAILKKNREQAAHTFELPADADAMRVVMNGIQAPAGKLPIKGESGRHYGRRGFGEVFLIERKDFPGLAMMVSPYQEFQAVAPQTILPPPPTNLVEQKAVT